jgi:hypothetical protein
MRTTLASFEDFDEMPTKVIPAETMRQLVYGEGHAPAGPSKPTRDLGPLDEAPSDGVPIEVDDDPTAPAAKA